MSDNALLRLQIQQQRSALGSAEQLHASQRLADQISQSELFKQSEKIAFYQAHGGEIDPAPLLKLAWKSGKLCYLPVVDGNGANQLYFAPVEQDTVLIPNRYQIAEPEHQLNQRCPAEALDLVLVPLVAVDSSGNRVGMGKGYYDRSFAFMLNNSQRQKPFLLGLGHDFQLVETLVRNAWDVPLNGLATNSQLILF